MSETLPLNGPPAWLLVARAEMGVHEIPGPMSTARILEYHASTKLRATDDAVPWCSAFACWCMEKALAGSPKSARAFDWLDWGISLPKPILGCVVVLTRGENNGHVGFYEYETDISYALLGGNQHDSVNVTKFAKERAISFRMPPESLWKLSPQLWQPPLRYPPDSGYEGRRSFAGH